MSEDGSPGERGVHHPKPGVGGLADRSAPDESGERPMRRAFLGLGSNLGNRREYLTQALAQIPDLVAVSSAYETDPIGGPEQDAFLNIVVELDTALTGHELLDVCRWLEQAADRVRIERWGPRTLDVDVLWIDGETIDDGPDLYVPHPRMFDRAFVMVPLGELAPDLVDGWTDPGEGEVRRLGPLHRAGSEHESGCDSG